MNNRQIIDLAKTLIEAEIEGQIDPTWTIEMFERWLVDAQNNLVLRIKDELLGTLFVTSTSPAVHFDFLKLIKVTRDGKDCFVKKITNASNTLYMPTVEFPTVYQVGRQLKIEPENWEKIEVIYVRQPIFAGSFEENELPDNWQLILPKYICAMALFKDKRYDEGSHYLTLFDNEIAMINAKGWRWDGNSS